MWRSCNTYLCRCRLDPDMLQPKVVLQTNETLDQTDAQADEGSDHEHEQQGLTGDSAGESDDPVNRLGNDQGNIRKDFSHEESSFTYSSGA